MMKQTVKRSALPMMLVLLTVAVTPIQAKAASTVEVSQNGVEKTNYVDSTATQSSANVASQLKLNKTKATIYVGSTVTLKVSGASGTVNWVSKNKKIAIVTKKTITSSKVTAKKAGKTTITAKCGEKSVNCTVTVKKPYLNRTKKTLCKGKSYKLKITGTKAVSWKSSRKSIATVNNKGKVTAKKAGKTAITCRGKDGKLYKCIITVKNKKESGLTASTVYKKLIAMKSKYPEGMSWTNDNYYAWKGGIYSGGYGCMGFAFALSDAAFGDLPARVHTNFSNIRVGDIVRVANGGHSVIVLEVKSDGVVVAEGNMNGKVRWGRKLSNTYIKSTGTYVITRYPQ